MNALSLAQEYTRTLKNTPNSDNLVYCMRIFENFLETSGCKNDASDLKADLFKCFFGQYLPYNICQEDDSVIESFYPCIRSFCKNTDSGTGSDTLSALNSVSVFAKGESRRIMYVKKNIMRFIKSPLIHKNPALIDMERYRLKTEKSHRRSADCLPENGHFKVADIFTNNSVVLKKISGYTFFIRVYLDGTAIDTIRPGDILDITVHHISPLGGWAIDDIAGCLARDSI